MAGEVYHRIYTHAPDGPFDTTGAKIVELNEQDARMLLPEDMRKDLDGLLRKITVAGAQTGYVILRYASEDDAYACVVTCYPDLVKDAQGRDGLLTHARVVRVEPGDAWFDVTELVEAAGSFPLQEIWAVPEEQRLASYVTQLSGESVILRSVDTASLQEIPPQFLADFVTASLATIGARTRTQFLVPHPGQPLIAQLARASCALPLHLQRISTWGLEVGEGCPVDAVFSTSSGNPPSAAASERLVACAKSYVDFLGEAPDALHAILRNPEITTVAEFGNAVDRASVGAPLTAALGKGEMTKPKNRNKQAASAPAGGDGGDEDGALDPEIVAEINRQVRAVEKELRIYFNQQLGEIEERMRLKGGPDPHPSGDWWKDRRIWGRIAFAVLVVGFLYGVWKAAPPVWNKVKPVAKLIFYGSKSGAGGTPPVSAGTDTSSTTQGTTGGSGTSAQSAEKQLLKSVVEATDKKESAKQKWADEHKKLIDEQPAIANQLINDASADRDVRTGEANELASFATRIAAKEDLEPEGRDRLRKLLVDYIAMRIVKGDDKLKRNVIVVDGQLGDVKPVLAAVKTAAGVKSTKDDFEDMHFLGEIIVRWMEKEYRDP